MDQIGYFLLGLAAYAWPLVSVLFVIWWTARCFRRARN
jgi:hypothetical protein